MQLARLYSNQESQNYLLLESKNPFVVNNIMSNMRRNKMPSFIFDNWLKFIKRSLMLVRIFSIATIQFMGMLVDAWIT